MCKLLWAGIAFLAQPLPVAQIPTRARTPQGDYISWREHLIDDQQLNGGIPIRGGDGVQMADFDKDGHLDIVSVHEDSSHVRLAFGSNNPDRWTLATLAEGKEAAAAEDAAVADLNGDGWTDIIVACELDHLIYFQNPGSSAAVRAGKWPRVAPASARNRGSFIRVFFADLNRDGRPEVTAANKGEQLPTINPATQKDPKLKPKEISWFAPPRNPLDANGWKENVLARVSIPINVQPADLDGDGDLDLLGGARGEGRCLIFENVTPKGGAIAFKEHPFRTTPHKAVYAFMADFADFNEDGRLDAVMNESRTNLAWYEQPKSFDQPWIVHSIGTVAPDNATGIRIADINNDGRPDVITGGYSQDPRDRDAPPLTPDVVAGRIAWFENPGDVTKPHPAKQWIRHDISRTRRGMYDAFLARDIDGDGDVDFVATRGNSGNFDGVFWLEQVRSKQPAKSFQPARAIESAHLPLP